MSRSAAQGHEPYLTSFSNGFWPTAPQAGPDKVPNSIRDGKNVWLLPGGSPNQAGLVKSANGVGSPMGQGGDQLYLVGSEIGVVRNGGSVVQYLGASQFFVGDGEVFLADMSIGTATSALKFRIDTGMGIMTFTAGLSALTQAPVIADSGNPGKNKGTYSVKLARFSSITAAESNESPPSNIISVSGKKIRITLPAAQAGSTQDIWRIYVTLSGFGSEGPYLFLRDEMVGLNYAGGSVEIDWFDNEPGSEQPKIDYDTPLPALFVATLQNIVILIGVGNGFVAVSPSIAGNPEAFPSGSILLTTPTDMPIGLAGRPSQNELFFWTGNSLQSVVYINDPDQPIQIRGVWPTTGIQSRHGGTFAEDDFYGFSGDAGGCPVRNINDRADTEFARPVKELIRLEQWDATQVVVAYDRRFDAVLYCHGTTVYAYMRLIDKWIPKIEIPSGIQASVTKDGIAYLSFADVLRKWEDGPGAADWFVKGNNVDDPDPGTKKTATGFRGAVKTTNSVTLDLLIDDETTPRSGNTVTDSAGSSKVRLTEWVFPTDLVTQQAFKFSGTGGGEEVYFVEHTQFYDEVRRT